MFLDKGMRGPTRLHRGEVGTAVTAYMLRFPAKMVP